MSLKKKIRKTTLKVQESLKGACAMEPGLCITLNDALLNTVPKKLIPRKSLSNWEGMSSDIGKMMLLNLVRKHPNDCIIQLDDAIRWFTKEEIIQQKAGLWKEIGKCRDKDKRFILLSISLYPSATAAQLGEGDDQAHANVIIFDMQNQTVSRFDPHGPTSESYNPEELNYNLKQIFTTGQGKRTLGRGWKYRAPIEYCPVDIGGPQMIEEFDEWEVISPGQYGFCGIWSHWFADLYLTHPDKDIHDIFVQATKQVVENPSAFASYIIDYAKFFQTMKQKIRNKKEFEKLMVAATQ